MVKKILISLAAVGVLLILVFVITSRTSSTVVVEHTFNAPVEKVWQLWNDPETIKKWWGPHSYFAPTVQNDPQVNGKFLLGMQGPNGKTHWNAGVYTDVIPMQKMVARMYFSDENGNQIPSNKIPVPGKWPDEIMVTFEFTPVDGKTKVTVTEVGIPTIMSVFAKMGWKQQFEKFDDLLK